MTPRQAMHASGPNAEAPARSVSSWLGAPFEVARPAIVGHRGYAARAPENTLTSLRVAIACGVRFVEIDVHGTRDSVPVVLHDATLDRTTTGMGPVGDWLSWELRREVAIDRRRGHAVPTLAEALETVRGKARLAIEVKAPEITEGVLWGVAAAAMEREVTIWSFYADTLRIVQALSPALPHAFLHRNRRDNPDCWSAREFLDRAARLGVPAVSFFPQDLDADLDLIDAAHEMGIEVYTGTVNDGDRALRLAGLGIDALVTDEPVELRAALAARLHPVA
ncbi:MAG: glycerophosphodiester phosphodiesterase [Dehalococcoidia bacterium]